MFASRWRPLISLNREKFRASRPNSCTVAMPVMFSCRNALMRAIHARTVRYESLTCRLNHCVTTTMRGSTEKATSASRQSIASSTIMIPASVKMSPNTETTPEVNRSFSASTSVVTRVIIRPTGLRS